ncbi:MAG: prolipoprotein diacylglyceryl transferase [Candidatus Promineifilaceae bacterium]|nr:prolipoprotein diacylglyceryl transferase [Candidatus Promineifilaceae bacterium]
MMGERPLEPVRLRTRLRAVEPYWFPIAIFLLAAAALFVWHLLTGQTPDPIALHVSTIGFDVYWYGVILMTGILLGAYVVSRLAYHRAVRVCAAHVPLALRRLPLPHLGLALPEEVRASLARHHVETVGELLLRLGFGGEALGLNRDGEALLRERLLAQPQIEAAWVEDPPWRVWNPGHVWNGLIWCLILGVIGARLYHVLTPSPSMAAVGIEGPLDYLRNPYYLLNIRRGGLGIFGGIAGGALGLLIYAYRLRLPALAWADIAAIGLALGQSVGRWANFVNQELYGAPTDLPWAIFIDPAHRLSPFVEFERFHPAFLYESVWNFLVFLLLLFLWRRYRARLLTGDLVALYLILYGVGRVLMETVRLDSATLALFGIDVGMAVATAVSLVLALVMVGWLLVRHWQRRPSEPAR